MALLFTFVLFGTSLIWSGITVLSWSVFAFAIAVVAIRPIAFFASLAGTSLDFRSRLLIAWFGPRGLSSLLLILLPVFVAVPGTDLLFFICCFVVLFSVVLHGSSLMFLRRNGSIVVSSETTVTGGDDRVPEESPVTSISLEGEKKPEELITIAEMRKIQQSGAPNLVLDVRAERSHASSDLRAQGALRILPDRAVERLTELDVPRQTWLFAFCS
jgi:NhaP-type Na+/H+ or K+/H+ antiporter